MAHNFNISYTCINKYVRFTKETSQDTRHLALIKGRDDWLLNLCRQSPAKVVRVDIVGWSIAVQQVPSHRDTPLRVELYLPPKTLPCMVTLKPTK